MIENILLIIATLIIIFLIWKISDAFQSASSYLGRNLSNGVRGATINAIGSSAPELLITIVALFFGVNDVSQYAENFAFGIGASTGSAVFNTIIIPACVIFSVCLFRCKSGFSVNKKTIKRDGVFLIFTDVVLIILLSFNILSWYHGAILILLYLLYIFILKKSMSGFSVKGDYDDDLEKKSRFKSFIQFDLRNFIIQSKLNNKNAIFLLLLSTFLLGVSCFYLIEICNIVAIKYHISTFFMAITLGAIATSVPDMVISVRDGLKGEYEDSLSNVLGSNIFDLCIGIGLPVLIFTLINDISIDLTGSVIDEYMIELRLFIITSDLLMIFLFLKKIRLRTSLYFIIYYVIFFISLVSIMKG